MRLLVVYCHPDPDSFNAAVLARVVEAATKAGHQTDVLDLYAEGFEPAMGRDERRVHFDTGQNQAPVAAHIARLQRAEGLIFVYPTWWYGQPAMLKGWLDRVLVPGVAFHLPQDGAPIRPGLTGIRLVGVVTTLGCPWWFWTFYMGAPGRRILTRGIKAICAKGCTTFWLALHNMDSASDTTRRSFLERVGRRIGALA
ncbi:MAG: NAD(P)H-dependent oxidoreductase [Pseudomonadota bacterium]